MTKYKPKPPFEREVGSKYGAPMGRQSDLIQNFDISTLLHIQSVRLHDGDYDKGGAYWGGGLGSHPLYCVWDDEGNVFYMRAPQGIAEVMKAFTDVFPEGVFWDHRKTK